MPIIATLIIGGLCFGAFWLIDQGFTKLFRNQAQHKSGQAVRLNKRYCTFGLILFLLGVACLFAVKDSGKIMLFAGILIMLVAVGMIVYYMTFGVFYDEDGFVLTTFGKRSTTYAYKDICGQMLYSGGNVIVELHMSDKRTMHLPVTMDGVYTFLDTAFAGWLAQTGKRKEECEFYDPDNSCWFPNLQKEG